MQLTTVTPPVAQAGVEDAALESLLAAVDVRIRRQRRMHLDDDQSLALDPSALTFAYVLSGDLHTRLSGEAPGVVHTGDILLTSGRRAGALIAHGEVSLVISELELADDVSHILGLLPDVARIPGFATLEPAAAALLPHMGVDDEHQDRGGDLVICRMMAKTVLVSLIRAWAANGCAPEGWPVVATDPFLDRVVAAIHAEPGREWTLEVLASVGAMSRSVFAQRFRSTFGRSPAGYVTAVRMRAAQDLLARGHGVSSVSRELGYSSDEGFSRAFRRSVGVTPSAWRARHQLATA